MISDPSIAVTTGPVAATSSCLRSDSDVLMAVGVSPPFDVPFAVLLGGYCEALMAFEMIASAETACLCRAHVAPRARSIRSRLRAGSQEPAAGAFHSSDRGIRGLGAGVCHAGEEQGFDRQLRPRPRAATGPGGRMCPTVG